MNNHFKPLPLARGAATPNNGFITCHPRGEFKNQVSIGDAKKWLKKKNCKSTEIYNCEWIDNALPIPTKEFMFHNTRKWRFDFAFIKEKVAIEIDGAIWANGRHNRGSGFIKDLDKINSAQCLGWIVLRYLPKKINFNQIKEALNARNNNKNT
jgi:hypothetical protein